MPLTPEVPRLPALLLPGIFAIGALGLMTVSGRGMNAMPSSFEGEDLPGGAATTNESVDTRDAFSHFSHGIGFEGEARFKVGNAIFR
jgi:CxxC motif-containing protein (DUF1111 family)